MRGKGAGDATIFQRCRITPAYAGKSFAQYDAAFWEWGSPPPMRGKVRKSRLDLIHKGITPAYAGKR